MTSMASIQPRPRNCQGHLKLMVRLGSLLMSQCKKNRSDLNIFFLHNKMMKVGGRVQGHWPDYLANRADQKNEGPLGGKIVRKSRNSCWVNGGGVGAHGQLIQGANLRNPATKYKRSKNVIAVTSVVLNLGHIWAQLLQLPVKSLIGSPGSLVGSLFETNRTRRKIRHSHRLEDAELQTKSDTTTLNKDFYWDELRLWSR